MSPHPGVAATSPGAAAALAPPSAPGDPSLTAPSERAALLLIPTQFCRGRQFTRASPMGKLRLGKELYPKPPTNKWECQVVSGTWCPGLRRAGPVPLAALHPAWRWEAPGPGIPQGQDPLRGLGTEAFPNRGPSCRLHCRGSRRSQQMGRADQTGYHRRTRSGRTSPEIRAPSLPGLGALDRLKPSPSQAPPPAAAACASEFPGTFWGPPSSLSLPELVLPSSFSLVIKKH